MTFTTRPELSGTFGMVTSTHWIASAVGMRLLEAGGTAADACVGAGFALNVLEPHLNGPLGEVPILVRPADAEAPTVICGQGTAPAGATRDHYISEGIDLIPASGLLATVIPGAFDAWMILLRDHGHLTLREVLEPAIYYAEHGHPMLAGVAKNIAELADVFRTEWPTSAPVWLPNGAAPAPGALFRNPDLAAMWTRLLAEAEAVTGRDAQIEAARRAFSQGFVAEAIDDYLRDACVMDSTGARRKGLLTGQDMATWEASYEAPISVTYRDWSVWKCGAWTQGPVLLQALQILGQDDIAAMDPVGDGFVHLVTEALKRAFADREAYYGDPDHFDIPLETLLSNDHAACHRADISDRATLDQRPGAIAGLEHLAEAFRQRATQTRATGPGIGAGEPTMAHLTQQRGDTVHIDVVDRWGNMVAATPSGGWLKSNPVVPGLGVPLNTRAQMFWIDDGLPSTLGPGRRPRTTLTPSMATHPDGRAMAFGTPGGDQQEQWQLIFLLRHLNHGLNLQAAIDGPLFNTAHLQGSFYPRQTVPGHLMVEPAFSDATIAALRDRGHLVDVAAPWSVGRLTAASRAPDGVLRAAATPRLMQAYAVGR